MEKYIYNEQTGISYTLCGDYYLPDLTLSDEEKGAEIGEHRLNIRMMKGGSDLNTTAFLI